jgi:sugar lactone lactonase YvrE
MWKMLHRLVRNSMIRRHAGASRPRKNGLNRPPRIEPLEDRYCPSQFLLVSDYKTNGQVLRYDGTDGHFIDVFIPPGSGGLHNTEYVFSDADGSNILVNGTDTHNILRYSLPDGSPNPAMGQSGAQFVAASSGGLVQPEGFLFGPDGNFYVANTTTTGGNVLRYDGQTGQFLNVFIREGTGGLSKANYMAIGPDGDLYVSDYHGASFNNGHIYRYNATTGAPIHTPGRKGANFIEPLNELANAFTWGRDGNLYVSVDPTTNAGSILRFNGVTGDPLPAPGQTGATFVPPGVGGVQFIDGIAFGDDGALYATDSFHGAIQRYDGRTGAYLGAFVPPGSGGLVNPGGLLFL